MSSECPWAALRNCASSLSGPHPAAARSLLTRAITWAAVPPGAAGAGAGAAERVAGGSLLVRDGAAAGLELVDGDGEADAEGEADADGEPDGEAEPAVEGDAVPAPVADRA